MTARLAELDRSISEAQEIRAAFDDLAAVRDKAYLASLGILPEASDDSSSEEDSTSSETEDLLLVAFPVVTTIQWVKLQLDIGHFPSVCGICPNKNRCDLPNCPSNKRVHLRRICTHYYAQCAMRVEAGRVR